MGMLSSGYAHHSAGYAQRNLMGIPTRRMGIPKGMALYGYARFWVCPSLRWVCPATSAGYTQGTNGHTQRKAAVWVCSVVGMPITPLGMPSEIKWVYPRDEWAYPKECHCMGMLRCGCAHHPAGYAQTGLLGTQGVDEHTQVEGSVPIQWMDMLRRDGWAYP